MSILFSEVNLGGVRVKNRFCMAPMGYIHDEDGGVNAAQKAYLVERANNERRNTYPDMSQYCQ